MNTPNLFIPPLESAICEVPDLAIIKISGPDARTFLQGQLTVNIDTITSSSARLCAQCDPKGKTVGLGHILSVGEDIWFVQHKDGIASSLQQFNKFGVFAKAEFTLVNDLQAFAFIGEDAAKNLQSCEVSYTLPFMPNIFIGWTSHALSEDLTNELASQALFPALCIQAGIPFLEQDSASEWVPQMLNLQALNAIDFDKGCYLGQEVVARTKYLGKNKRQAMIFSCAATEQSSVTTGAAIEQQLGDNWRKVGNVINTAKHEDKHWILAVVPNNLDDGAVLRLAEKDLSNLSVHPLPYVIEQEESMIKKRKAND